MAHERTANDFQANIRKYFMFPVSLIGAIITTISVAFYLARGDYNGLLKYFQISLPSELVSSIGIYSHQVVEWAHGWLSVLLQFSWFQYIAAAIIIAALSGLGAAAMFAAEFRSISLRIVFSILISLPITTFASISAAQLSGEVFPNIDQYPSASGGQWYHSIAASSSGWIWPDLEVKSEFMLSGASQSISNRELFVLTMLSGAAIGATVLYGAGGLAEAILVGIFAFLMAQTYLDIRNYPRPPAADSPSMPSHIEAHACSSPLNSQLMSHEQLLIDAVKLSARTVPLKISGVPFFSSDEAGMYYVHCMQFSPALDTAFREMVLYKTTRTNSSQCEFSFVDGTMVKGVLKITRAVKLVSFSGSDCANALSAPGRGAGYLDVATLAPYFVDLDGRTIALQ